MRARVLWVCLVVACGGDNGHAIDAPGAHDDGPGVDAPPPDAPLTSTESGIVFEGGLPLMIGSSITDLPPVVGAQVCSEGLAANACDTTGSDGSYSLDLVGVPGDSVQFAQTVTADGHLTTTVLAYSETIPGGFITTYPGGIAMLDDARGSALATAAGFAYPPVGSGFVRAFLLDAVALKPLAGATVSLVGGSAANGPVYFDVGSDGTTTPDPALTTTGSDGGALFGDVQPGTFFLTVTAAGRTCEGSGLAWPGSGGATVAGHIDAAAITDSVQVYCR